ncbi:alpha-amylase family glycosyl hydrolase [Ureibacillus sp. 179-F W5.1 NHS]|uniref:Alpha-amlyase n=1 Tax=Lysinibacillus halotolerans TaxID=1368476 RepID=A0A3M8HE28_9BACI|nr:alpha-amylase family glycosyl hydrolase [Lysinibacillus halotolerans]RND00632.1 alpha-amlyase [Lysinibacillus halotolerans]
MLKFKKWISGVAASLLLIASLTTSSVAKAEETKSIEDESIYDLLVDRILNGTLENDYNANAEDPSQFAGGDFKGLLEKRSLITKMGFTIASIGSVFTTETYDGSMVTSYSQIEPQFGTPEELTNLIDTFHDDHVKIMIDFPLSNVSENHEWAQDPEKADWIVDTANGKVRWDLNNEEVQQALINSVVEFITTYNVDGVRLTNLDTASTPFLNEMIEAIKSVNNDIYVISNEDSDANFDAKYFEETNDAFRNAYKNVDQNSAALLTNVTPFVEGKQAPAQLMIDSLLTDRFTLSAEAYPPTRVRLAIAATLLLPGVPVMQYGTEIIMNGEAGPNAHQLYNFRTDEDMVEFIGDVQTLRNQSETLRNGEFKLIKNENGFLVFERYSDEERWIIVINNTGKTTKVDISADEIGENKELRAMLDSDTIRVNDEGNFPIVLDREIVEIYQVTEEKGINVSYLIALGLVYLLFIGFIIALIKRGKRRRANQN